MIERIVLKDFQSHQNTVLELSPGLNVIVGPNGSGKSAVIRAIESVCFNTQGTAEVRWPDAKSYHIELYTNGGKVSRDKGEGINSYTINDSVNLIDVSRDVPEQVAELLKIKPVDLDSSCDITIQFANQMDSPFMLCEKESVKMKFLNTLSGTNAVDLAAKEAVQITKENNKQVKEKTAKIAELKAQLEELTTKLDRIKKANLFIKNKLNDYNEMQDLLKKMQAVKSKSDKLVLAYKRIRLFMEQCQHIDADGILNQIDRLVMLRSLYDRCYTAKNKWMKLANIKSKIDAVDVTALSEAIDKYSNLMTLAQKYKLFKTNTDSITSRKKQVNEQYNQTVEQYVHELQVSKQCPVCANQITDACIDNIKKSL